uniref:Uncharacterized protein n=1 Tax=Riboviria sp. TaxID=2585031 RepID=A0A8K1N3G7_9VIRU|nr:MAG: putative protein [Riboviria sp.]
MNSTSYFNRFKDWIKKVTHREEQPAESEEDIYEPADISAEDKELPLDEEQNKVEESKDEDAVADPVPESGFERVRKMIVTKYGKKDARRKTLLDQLNRVEQRRARIRQLSSDIDRDENELKRLLEDPECESQMKDVVPIREDAPVINTPAIQSAARHDKVIREELSSKVADEDMAVRDVNSVLEELKDFCQSSTLPASHRRAAYVDSLTQKSKELINAAKNLELPSMENLRDFISSHVSQNSVKMAQFLAWYTKELKQKLSKVITFETCLFALVRLPKILRGKTTLKESLSDMLATYDIRTKDLISAARICTLPRSKILRLMLFKYTRVGIYGGIFILRRLLIKWLEFTVLKGLKSARCEICRLGSIILHDLIAVTKFTWTFAQAPLKQLKKLSVTKIMNWVSTQKWNILSALLLNRGIYVVPLLMGFDFVQRLLSM